MPESGEIDPVKFARLLKSVREVAAPWHESSYYDDAEHWMREFWNDASPFKEQFDTLDLTRVIDLAAGHGRHAARVAPMARDLIVLDVHAGNIEFCKSRLGGFSNISYVLGDGFSFYPVESGSVTAIFCYDAMVHFSADVVEAYVTDAARVLAPGGRALFHHSNYAFESGDHYGKNPHARNTMTQALFTGFAAAVGLEVCASTVIAWCEVPALDCVTMVRKASEELLF